MSKILHNPKSHAPAVYIPCWLIQVSVKLITPGAKLLYGRLTQWANAQGKVFRSSPQLSQELGTGVRQIERQIKELKELALIGTYHPQAGGVNHFEFYDHPWMHESINDNLVYKSDPPTPKSLPPDIYVGTPPTYKADINIKEIKRNKKDNNIALSVEKREKERKELLKPKKPKSTWQADDLFMRFYNAYPVRKDAKRAYSAFKRLSPNEPFLEILLQDIEERSKNDDNWLQGFIPHPSTYLNGERWTDAIRNTEEERKKRKAQAQVEGERKRQELERISQERAEQERIAQQHKQTDAIAYRNLTKQLPQGLKGLKQAVGLR